MFESPNLLNRRNSSLLPCFYLYAHRHLLFLILSSFSFWSQDNNLHVKNKYLFMLILYSFIYFCFSLNAFQMLPWNLIIQKKVAGKKKGSRGSLEVTFKKKLKYKKKKKKRVSKEGMLFKAIYRSPAQSSSPGSSHLKRSSRSSYPKTPFRTVMPNRTSCI